MSETVTTLELESSNIYDQDSNSEEHEDQSAKKKYFVEKCIEVLNKSSLSPPKLLKETIENTFSTLSICDRQMMTTTICNILNGSFPNKVNLTASADASQCESKEGLLLALSAAEKRNAGISEKVLISLINLPCAPRLTDSILEFLVFEFNGEIQVISRYKPHSAVNSLGINRQPVSYHECSHGSTFFCSNLKEHLKKHKRAGRIFKMSSILLNVLLLLAFCSMLIMKYAGSNTESICIENGMRILNVSTTYNDSLKATTVSTNVEDEEFTISIKSYNEYVQIFPVFSPAQPFTLYIYLDNEYDWPENGIIFNSSLVKGVHFGGWFSFNKIGGILKQVKNIKTIAFDNKKESLCLHNKQQNYNRRNNILPGLEHLKLTRISECAPLLNYIYTNIDISRLHKLTIEDSVLNDQSVEYVQKIVTTSGKFLQHLVFPNTTFSTALLKNKLGTLGAVRSLRIDILNDYENPFNFIPKEIQFILPNLQSFSSKHGFISLIQLRHILKCKQLSFIDAGLEIPNNQIEINLVTLLGSPNKLSQINLSLKFPYTENESSCKISGLRELRKRMKFDLWHNCTTDVDDEYVNY